MGTRGSFWIGDPKDLEGREWLGCIAMDAHIENFADWATISTEDEFRTEVAKLHERKDFAHPSGGWPFPWDDDIFLTDVTYAFTDGQVKACLFYAPFMTIPEWMEDDGETDLPDVKPEGVPAPSAYNPSQPDSIIVLGRED